MPFDTAQAGDAIVVMFDRPVATSLERAPERWFERFDDGKPATEVREGGGRHGSTRKSAMTAWCISPARWRRAFIRRRTWPAPRLQVRSSGHRLTPRRCTTVSYTHL